MRMFNTVNITEKKYKELITAEEKRKIEDFELSILKLKADNEQLKRALLESNLKNNHHFNSCTLEQLIDIDDWSYGLYRPATLFMFFTIDEMNDFIKKKKEEYDRKIDAEIGAF